MTTLHRLAAPSVHGRVHQDVGTEPPCFVDNQGLAAIVTDLCDRCQIGAQVPTDLGLTISAPAAWG